MDGAVRQASAMKNYLVAAGLTQPESERQSSHFLSMSPCRKRIRPGRCFSPGLRLQ